MHYFQFIFFISAFLIPGCSKDETPTDTNNNPVIVSDTSCADWAEFTVNEYLLSNNVWGKGTDINYEQCIYYSTADGNTEFGWNWNWSGNGSVRAYPEIIFGLKPWSANSTSDLLPARINSKNITLEYTASASAIGQWNLSYDIWLADTISPTMQNVTHEIMIWMYKTDSISPAGTKRGTLAIGGNNFDLWVNENHGDGWTYIAFVSDKTILSRTLDLNAFLNYLITNSYITSNLFISGIEFGTEIFEGKGNFKLTKYNVEVQ